MSENRMLRISAPKLDQITVDCRNLHSEDLHNSHCSPYITKKNQFKDDDMDRACSTQGGDRIQGFAGKS
jgi:hypothetical protein